MQLPKAARHFHLRQDARVGFSSRGQCWKSMIVHERSQDVSACPNPRTYICQRDCHVVNCTAMPSVQGKLRMVLGRQLSIQADRTGRSPSGLLDDGHFSQPCDDASDGAQLTCPALSFGPLLSLSAMSLLQMRASCISSLPYSGRPLLCCMTDMRSNLV